MGSCQRLSLSRRHLLLLLRQQLSPAATEATIASWVKRLALLYWHTYEIEKEKVSELSNLDRLLALVTTGDLYFFMPTV